MTRANSSGAVGWLRWVLGGFATLLFAILMFLITSTASRLQNAQDRLGTQGIDIAKLEGRLNALETRVADLSARLSGLETKLDRVRNPRPWETGQPARRER